MASEEKQNPLVSKDSKVGEALTEAAFWFAASGVARNQRLYDKLHQWTDGLYRKKDLKDYMRSMEKAFLNSEFCSARSPALAVRALEVYSILKLSSHPRMCLSELLLKNCTKYRNDLVKRKGKFPPAKEFVDRDGFVDGGAEKFAMYQFVLAGLAMEKTGKRVMEAGADFEDGHRLMMTYMLNAVTQNVSCEEKPHRVSPIEKYFRGVALDENKKSMLLDFIDESNMLFFGAAIESFAGTKDVLGYQFTEKDAEYIAWVLSQAAAAMAVEKEKKGAGLSETKAASEALSENLKGSTEDHIEEIIRKGILKDEISGIDWNYIRIGYAFAKVNQRDRKDVFDLYIDAIPEDEDRKFVSKDEYDKLKREYEGEKRKFERRQLALNKVQLELDRERAKNAELKEKQHEMGDSLKEMQKLLEDVSKPETHVDDIASDERYEFPENTVLFGGHPNWQRKFRLLYPAVKVYDADDMSFSADVIRNAGLVLLNVTHMSHKQFHSVIQQVRKHHKRIEYIK